MARTNRLFDRDCRSSIRSTALLGLAIALASVASAQAATYSALVRWQPSASAEVTGYRVYVRTAGGLYGTGRDVGLPARAADGTQQTTWSGLDNGTGYAVVVTAYDAAGTESPRSNELALPVIAPPPPPVDPPPSTDPPPTDPPPPATAFGNATIGGTSLGVPSQAKRASRFVLDHAGGISRLWLYVANPTSSVQLLRPVVYADVAGQPTTLLATGPDVSVAAFRPASWIAIPLTTPIALAPGAYWLGVHAGDTGACRYFVGSDSAGQAQNADLFGNGPTNPFGPVSPGTGPLSIYAESDPTIETRSAPPAHWFGTAVVGGTGVPLAGDVKRVSAFSLAEPGLVSRLWMYLANPSTEWQTLRAIVYADGASAPAALVALGAEVALPPGTDATWVALPFDQPNALAGGRYWLGALAGPTSGAALFFTDDTPGGRLFASDTYADGVSDPFGAAAPSTGIVSVYAEYEPEDPTTPPGIRFFGDPQIETTQQTMRSNRRHASPFTLTEAASVSRLWMYLANPGTAAQVMRAIVYTDEAGAPGALVATGDEATVAAGAPARWTPLSFPGAVALAPGRYWIGSIAGPTTSVIYFFGTQPNARARRNDLYANGPNDRFGSADLGLGPISVLAEYTPGPRAALTAAPVAAPGDGAAPDANAVSPDGVPGDVLPPDDGTPPPDPAP